MIRKRKYVNKLINGEVYEYYKYAEHNYKIQFSHGKNIYPLGTCMTNNGHTRYLNSASYATMEYDFWHHFNGDFIHFIRKHYDGKVLYYNVNDLFSFRESKGDFNTFLLILRRKKIEKIKSKLNGR